MTGQIKHEYSQIKQFVCLDEKKYSISHLDQSGKLVHVTKLLGFSQSHKRIVPQDFLKILKDNAEVLEVPQFRNGVERRFKLKNHLLRNRVVFNNISHKPSLPFGYKYVLTFPLKIT